MKLEKSRSVEKIFAEMHRELRSWNSEIPESQERLDPILRMLLQLYSNQLAKIEKRIDSVWDIATSSLIRSLFPDSKRWPVPAFAIMRCELTDPVVEVDPYLKLIYREKREDGQTFFFSPHRTEKLLAANVRYILLRNGNELIDIRRKSPEEQQSPPESSRLSSPEQADTIFVGIDFEGSASEFADAVLFVTGDPLALKQIRWSHWVPGTDAGQFSDEHRFCPGLTTSIDDIFRVEEGSSVDWGGLRSTADLFRPIEDSFVVIPGEFVSLWKKGPACKELGDLAFRSGIELPGADSQLFWIRLDLPEGGDRRKLTSPIEILSNSFVATNKNELTLFKHTGGNKLVEVELPEDISNVLEITRVVDSEGREYRPVYEIQTDTSKRAFSSEEKNDKMVLWFDFPSVVEVPPDSITVTYSVTSGTRANGIETGEIEELYEGHPGISACINITPTRGAVPAKTPEQIVKEATARLRGRDRAHSFLEMTKWAMTFDRRIQNAECENSTERTERGVRRCIVLRAKIKAEDFHSDDEIELLRTRLQNFLKSRSPVNTRFKVEIDKA
jgi:hypothetical protein